MKIQLQLFDLMKYQGFMSFIELKKNENEIFRLEYDACRTEMELLPPGSQLNEKQQEFEKSKEKYEKFKCDVSIKMKFLDENQVRISLI